MASWLSVRILHVSFHLFFSPVSLGIFHIFLLFKKEYEFLSYMCGEHFPLLILYLLILFMVFSLVQNCVIFREPNCQFRAGSHFLVVPDKLPPRQEHTSRSWLLLVSAWF